MKFVKMYIFLVLTIPIFVFSQTDPKFADYLASERANLPVEGELLYNGASLGGYRYGGGSGASKKTVDADSSMPFGKVMQLTIAQAGANSWEPQFQTPTNVIPVNKDDLLFYIFYIRLLETAADDGYGKALMYVQRSSSPWTGLGSLSLTVRTDWQKYYVIAKPTEDYDNGEMEATFHLGFFKQKIEIGGIIALNLGPGIDEHDLPANPVYYDGMAPDAPWRAEAAARIEQYRKGDLTVIVKNENNQPIKDASIKIEMKNHAYGFGTFMSELALSNTTNAKKYKEEVFYLFNRATTPFYMGDGSWGWYSSEQARRNYTNLAGWLQENEIPTKGHVLIWPSWTWMPPFFKELENDPAGLKSAIEEHLDTVVPVGKDKGLIEWDVVNEPHVNHDVMDICGENIMIDWYNQVHAIHPEARLILNEYNIIMGGGNPAFQDDFDHYITLLLEGGAPLGGLGMQCHFDANLTGIPSVLAILDRFAKHNLPIQVTEFDIDILDEEGQAAYMRDFYTAVFSHPATDKIVMWGFWEGDQWKPNGAMIRTDWTYKPNYDVYTDLLFKKWWTNEPGLSNRNGSYQTRGFLGDYEISASYDGYTVFKNISLTKAGATVEIQLPTSATGVKNGEDLADEFGLKQNYPNPFNASTIIEFTPDFTGLADLQIFDARGVLVYSKKMNVTKSSPCREELTFDFLPTGTYFYSVGKPDDITLMKKMLLIK